MTMRWPGATFLLLCSCLLVGASAAAEEFDRTLPVTRGTRLDVRLYGGTISVHAWDRDAVRIRATHFRTDEITVRAAEGALEVRARNRVGTPHAIDFDIAVPAWMPVGLGGTYLDIGVEGTRSGVVAETARGDVKVKGGAGTITLKSIEGEVVLEGGEGRADLTAVNNEVRVSGFTGELVVETVNGSVKLQKLEASLVEVGTFGGDVSWTGPVAPRGHYQFATHDGDIDITLPARGDAAISVRAFDGSFQSTYPVKVPDERARRNGFTFALGNASARLDLETFRGTISLRSQRSSD